MSNIRSLGDLGGAGSEDEDQEDFNDYYAGGEKSGQLVRGAPVNKEKQDEEDDDTVQSLFNKARRAGAVQGTQADLDPGSSAFRGVGRTLAGGHAQAVPSEGPVNHVITFYANNIFTVNDGPPRRVDDPANFAFIDSISKGECPQELEQGTPGMPVNVNLVRKDEEYCEPEKPKYTAFSGTGRTLGSSSASTSAGAGGSAAADAGAQADAGEWEGVNEGLPTTSIQLRLADGSRMVAKFNYSHRVSDIRRFIRASRPEMMVGPYQLMTGFPSQPISDESQTLEQAGLLNAVIIQKK